MRGNSTGVRIPGVRALEAILKVATAEGRGGSKLEFEH